MPDFFARLADGLALVIDVRPDDLVGADDAEVFAATQRPCTAAGWGYRRVGVVDAVLAATVHWLSGFRHRRCVNALAGSELETGQLSLSCHSRRAVASSRAAR